MDTIKIVWLSPYPMDVLVSSGLELTRPIGGHACSWIINWASALAGHPEVDLHIVTYTARIKRSQVLDYNGYKVHVIRDAVPFTDKARAGLSNLDARTGFYLRKRKLLSVIKKINPDIVHGHGTEEAFGLAAVQSGVPSVVSIQGVIADYLRTNPIQRFKYTVKTEETTVRGGHNFMCRTHFDKGFVKSLNANAKIFHMPEPMNPCFFEVDRSNAEAFRILHVGGFDPRKGMEELLLAVAQVKRRFPDVKVDIVGSGSAERKACLVSRAETLGLVNSLTFHGFLSAVEIAELHAKATLFVITPQNENSPNTLAEALCAGTPSVAYDVGGISSMFVDGESGFLVPAGNSEILTAKIEQLLSSPELRKRFSEKSRQDGQVNQPEQVALRSIQVYREIIADIRQ